MDIVPEFNTSCYLTINDRVRGDIRCYPLHRTGDAEKIVADFVVAIGGGRIVTRPYAYEIFDHTEQYVGQAWGWKTTEV
ncbi:MAG TPA: hypothetical protein VLO10_03415 [Candidatus Deferrimicrobium sp.]|nr:hypothetical protein [Candidatus Deferrimicrobium sp.]